ncbi:DEKNAAC102398 [Brettanomyces naardenensis]|uniref:DEKNAAC102398 n=1 Tax=Brettanomyces naardenensis TaxID=13370 RepID=A0A448YL87_BRENA|nr:DEKNAAC102398 [Brettanomyces naardenensis]
MPGLHQQVVYDTGQLHPHMSQVSQVPQVTQIHPSVAPVPQIYPQYVSSGYAIPQHAYQAYQPIGLPQQQQQQQQQQQVPPPPPSHYTVDPYLQYRSSVPSIQTVSPQIPPEFRPAYSYGPPASSIGPPESSVPGSPGGLAYTTRQPAVYPTLSNSSSPPYDHSKITSSASNDASPSAGSTPKIQAAITEGRKTPKPPSNESDIGAQRHGGSINSSGSPMSPSSELEVHSRGKSAETTGSLEEQKKAQLVVILNSQSKKPRIRLSQAQRTQNERMASQYSDRNKRLGSLSSFKLHLDDENELEVEADDGEVRTHGRMSSIDEMTNEISPVQTKKDEEKSTLRKGKKRGRKPKRVVKSQTKRSTSPQTIGAVAANVAAAVSEADEPLPTTANALTLPIPQPNAVLRVQKLTAEQEARLKVTNGNVARCLSSTSPADSDGVVEMLKETIPPVAALPEFPAIPDGFVPMMMSPQGLLVPMQYAPVDLGGRIVPTIRPIWNGSLFEMTTVGDFRERNNRIVTVPAPEEESLPVHPSSRKRFAQGCASLPKRQKLSSIDKLAAMRICLISKECYDRCGLNAGSRMKVEVTPVTLNHSRMVDYYIWLESDSTQMLKSYVTTKEQYIRKFNSLDGGVGDPLSNKYLFGLERDLMETRDYDLVREELFNEYRRGKIFHQYLEEVMETYSSICLDYTVRLLKLKKFLLRNRRALTGSKDQMYYVNSSKSEKLWRNFVKEERRVRKFKSVEQIVPTNMETSPSFLKDSYGALGSTSAYMALPNQKTRVSSTMATPSPASESSSSNSSPGTRTSRRARTGETLGKLPSKFPISDELTPMLSTVDFTAFTDPRSKMYEHYILNSGYSEVSDQSDIVELIEFFKVKSLLSDLYDLTNYHGQSAVHASPSLDGDNLGQETTIQRDMYAKKFAANKRSSSIGAGEGGLPSDTAHSASSSVFHKHLRSRGLNLTSSLDTRVSDSDRTKWLTLDEKEIRGKFTKAYPTPVGLTNEQIEEDLSILLPQNLKKKASSRKD